ncbi:tail fiber domain-containing protein [Providencia sp. PROV254]|uniref:tail fiber/spike domain-containing protein n=1 Tax=Providencia sp. PROV254 TaxID=2949942 RepID=UPI002349CDD3|nr:hypothetical protein [Providencia sp. PROV254]
MREVKPTQKPVPSSDIKDLFFNSGLLDIWATSLEHKYIDRFGNCHLTAAGMEWLFKELVEKFKIDMNTAIVAAGYITIDSFQQGANLPNNELTQRNHILRDETTGEYYRWDGDLPKQVPAGSTPQSTGGIGKGAWVSVGDASLRRDIKSNSGAAMIGVESGNTVQTELNNLNIASTSGKLGLLSNVKVFAELPLHPDGYSSIISQYGYSYIYPQGLKFIDGEIYISCLTEGGSNKWSWVYVFDEKTRALKSIFSAGDSRAKGLHITRIDGKKYLFLLSEYNSEGAGKTGVYELPDDIASVHMTRLPIINSCHTGQWYGLSGYDDELIIELATGTASGLSPKRRTSFNYVSIDDVINKAKTAPIGSMSLNNNFELSGKRQGIAIGRTEIATSHGGIFYTNSTISHEQIFAIRMSSFSGVESDSVVLNPDKMAKILSPKLKAAPSRIESEGLTFRVENGVEKLYSLVITTDGIPSGSGIVILEHGVSHLDEECINLSPASTKFSINDLDNNTLISINEVPFNKKEIRKYTSLTEILDMMIETKTQVYRFYNSESYALNDVLDNKLPNYTQVTINNQNAVTFYIEVLGSDIRYDMTVVKRDEGYTQSVNMLVQSGSSTVRPEWAGKRMITIGQDGFPSINHHMGALNPSLAAQRFYVGTPDNRVLAGSIVVSSNNTTQFNTTSDGRMKIEKGLYTGGVGVIKALDEAEALQNFEWKNNGMDDYGFIAQKLNKVLPKAVSYDEYSDTFGVSYASLVPDLVSAIMELIKRVETLEKKSL